MVSCGSQEGDVPKPAGEPPAAGKAHRIHEIADPDSPTKAAHQTSVSLSGVVVLAIDTFDETGDGKSMGSIYVEDLGSQEPYSGIGLYRPTFNPATLRIAPGDVLDMTGEYQENQSLPIAFAPGAFNVQLADPIATLRFDARSDGTAPKPMKIALEDLADYKKGRQWLGMLVTVENLPPLERDATPGSSGRLATNLMPSTGDDTKAPACTDPFPKVPTLVNELADLTPLPLKKGTVIKKLTGIVTFFCNLHIAPRSVADIELE